MGCRGRQIDFRVFCRVFTSGFALVVYVEYIGYIQRCRLAAWAAERFERDFRTADRSLFERCFPARISIVHLNSVTIYKMSNGFKHRAVVEELETFVMSHSILIVAVQFFGYTLYLSYVSNYEHSAWSESVSRHALSDQNTFYLTIMLRRRRYNDSDHAECVGVLSSTPSLFFLWVVD